MFCTNCGKEIQDSNTFCPFCGAQSPTAAKTEQAFPNQGSQQPSGFDPFQRPSDSQSTPYDYNQTYFSQNESTNNGINLTIQNGYNPNVSGNTKNRAVASMVLGIISIPFSALNYAGVPFVHLVGIVLGIIAISFAVKCKPKNAMVITGLVTGLVGLILGGIAFTIGFIIGCSTAMETLSLANLYLIS